MNMVVSTAALTATSCNPATAADDDSELLSLASEISRLYDLAHQDDDEVSRLCEIWTDECRRLEYETELPSDQKRRMIKAMPESAKHTQLVKKAEPYFASADRLMAHLWSLPAKTTEGKKAKLKVLFDFVLGDEWHQTDKDSDWEIKMARRLLFELAGVSNADILGEQSSGIAHTPSGSALLWAERQILVEQNNALSAAWKAADDQLPSWAKSGPRLLAHDGTYCGQHVGWPLDVSVKPSEHQSAYRVCRLSLHDVKENFDFQVGLFPGMSAEARAIHRANMRSSLRKVIALVRAQRAEHTRVGLYEIESQLEVVNDALSSVDDKILDKQQTADAKAAKILLSLQQNCSLDSSAANDFEMELACVPLEMLLPQLTGLIGEHVEFFLTNRTASLRDMPFALT